MGNRDTIGAKRILSLFDEGTFVEVGSFMKRAGSETCEGVIGGYGAVNGKLAYAFSQDADNMQGAVDQLHAKKIEMIYDMALKNGAPVIGLFDTAGAVVYDGAVALSSFGTLLNCAAKASGRVPQIAVITGVCPGMAAVAASSFDFVVGIEECSKLYVNSPFLIGKEVGTADWAAANGATSLTCENEGAAFDKVRALIDMLPANAGLSALVGNTDDCERVSAVNFADDLEASVANLCDAGSCLEIGNAYAPEMKLYVATMGGVTVGIVANNPAENNGNLTAAGARKASRFIGFCDAFNMPVVTLVNSCGVAVAKEQEAAQFSAELAKLSMAYAGASTAKITVLTGPAYGASFTLMGSKSLGADLVLALPEATIGVLSPEASVAFVWNDKVTAETSRESLVDEWKNKYAAPAVAAANGCIDDLVDAGELRARICSAVFMLMDKNEKMPVRKHSVLPL